MVNDERSNGRTAERKNGGKTRTPPRTCYTRCSGMNYDVRTFSAWRGSRAKRRGSWILAFFFFPLGSGVFSGWSASLSLMTAARGRVASDRSGGWRNVVVMMINWSQRSHMAARNVVAARARTPPRWVRSGPARLFPIAHTAILRNSILAVKMDRRLAWKVWLNNERM